jgi:hypothetical protein
MQTVGKFNTVSEELMKLIPQLEVGQAVTFEMLTGVKNNDPDEKERQRNPVLYPKANIPTRDRIKDPFLAQQGKDPWIELVVADYWDKERPIERLFVPGLSDGVTNFQFGGKFSLVGGNQRDEELYEYLMITNYNQDSILGEGRDNSKIPLFKVVNTKAASQKTLTGFAVLKEAISIVATMTPEDARKIGAALNWNEFTENDAILAEAANFARSNPEEFLKVYNDPNIEIKATIRKALDTNVLAFDMASGKVNLGTQEITTIAKQDRGNVTGALTQFVVSAKNGKEVYENIKSQVK